MAAPDRNRYPQQVAIREFEPADAEAFRLLNVEWITRYFRVEPKDEEILNNPQSQVLAIGGNIFIAAIGERRVGCCGLMPSHPDDYEIVKMAVAPDCRGLGIGRELLQAAVKWARAIGARRLHLETNSKLAPAVALYQSIGFRHIPADRVPPSPYTRADTYMDMLLR